MNTTVIGDYAKPKTRLPGSGGACEIAINAKQILMIMRLKKRAFVEKIDFVTSPGHFVHGQSRAELGLPLHSQGPTQVITDKATFDFNNADREMQVIELAPGETLESVQAELGWTLRVSPDLRPMVPPSAEELSIIREQLDPPYKEIAEYCHVHRDKVEMVFNTLAYFDGVNLPARAKAKSLFSTGLMDQVCPPSTVYAAYNHWGGEKDIKVYPYNGHEGGGRFQTLEKVKFLKSIW